MVKITIPGTAAIELTEREFDEMATAFRVMVKWAAAGMYGDGEDITEKVAYKRALKTLVKIGYGIE